MAHEIIVVALLRHCFQQHIRGLVNHRVALQEAIGIVIGLEVVDIGVAHRERQALLDSAAQRALDRDVARQARRGVGASLALVAAQRGAHARL